MKNVILAIVFTFGFSFYSYSGTGGSETGTLHGTIIDAETKKPVTNVTFSASVYKTSFQKEFSTDANGNFKILVPVGEHTIIIDKLGYKAVKKEGLIVKEGVVMKLNFEVEVAEEELHHPFLTPITIHSF
jgi:hypothetical protein